jgi:LuxR family maltose regulon positive regulatory protein
MHSTQRSSSYISRTKVTPPATSRFEVPRQAILERAGKVDTSRAVLVNAPAGFGKTTFMTQLMARYRRQGMGTVWLTLDDGDNDVSRFLSGFATALSRLQDSIAPIDLSKAKRRWRSSSMISKPFATPWCLALLPRESRQSRIRPAW